MEHQPIRPDTILATHQIIAMGCAYTLVPTLQALGFNYQQASHSLRLSMGRFTSFEAINQACRTLSHLQ